MTLNQRQMEILHTISKLEILTRSHIQRLHDTKSVRNTNMILHRLTPYLNSIRLNENAYYLNKRGIELVGMEKQFKFSSQVHHKLLRNDMYVFLRPKQWHTEAEFKIGSISIRPDVFLCTDKYMFLEVDNLQKWHVNVKKMESYSNMKKTGAFQKKYDYFPLLLWVTTFPGRKEKLLKLSKDLDVPIKVYTVNEIKA